MAFGDCRIERRAAAGSVAGAAATGEEERAPGRRIGRRGLRRGVRRGRREDALGTTSHERVEAQGCPHCAGREIVGWGHSHGLLRFRCKSCGRTFNAPTRTPMAHLRKKERWLDHARAMIEGKSPAKTAALWWRSSDDGLRWRHRFLRAPASDKPRSLRGIVEADETFILESFKGRWSDLPRKARASVAERPDMRAFIRTTYPFLSPATGRARPSTRSCLRSTAPSRALPSPASSRRAIISSATAARRSPLSPRKAGILSPRRTRAPGKPTPKATTLHINNVNAYHGRLKQWLNRFNGVATKNLPNYLGWRRALEGWGGQLAPQTWIKGAIGNGPYQQLTL